MRLFAHNFKKALAAQPRVICDLRFTAYTPMLIGSLVPSFDCRQSDMNT